jgi:hypothetical protein
LRQQRQFLTLDFIVQKKVYGKELIKTNKAAAMNAESQVF